MKMLLVNHLLDPVSGGGTAERTYQLARFMSKAGVECSILTLDIGETSQRKTGLGDVDIHVIPCINERFFVPRMRMEKIGNFVANSDIVLISGNWTILNAMVFSACCRLKKPFLFCPAGAMVPFGRSLIVKYLYERFVVRRLVQMAAACVAVTDAERADFTSYGVTDDRIVVIPNGVDSDSYQLEKPEEAIADFRESIGIGNARFVLFLGRLNPIKGPDLLLDAFARLDPNLSDVHLVMAGPDGGLLAQLKMDAALKGVTSRVHFVGYIGGENKTAALRSASLLAIPSRREAMSIVVLEGGVCRCPVIFSDACGLDDFASQGAGEMVAANVSQLTKALASCLRDSAKTMAFVDRLEAIVQQNYLWRVQAQRHIDLASRLITSSAGVTRSIEIEHADSKVYGVHFK